MQFMSLEVLYVFSMKAVLMGVYRFYQTTKGIHLQKKNPE